MIAATVQGNVDGIPKGSHGASVSPVLVDGFLDVIGNTATAIGRR